MATSLRTHGVEAQEMSGECGWGGGGGEWRSVGCQEMSAVYCTLWYRYFNWGAIFLMKLGGSLVIEYRC